ncbi:MAG: hypothetical protein E7549_05305 [Ruminococcaceae bacterium]|nr:hypothetical protein [Oscillospiraceae bacterium]
MDVLRFDLSRQGNAFKPLNAVNNGPCHKRHANDQWLTNLADYKAARIPYARNHDASFCDAYGSEHTVDISAVFPNFDADPTLPENYDFTVTDEYTAVTLDAGTKTFYRLGQKIEHYIKKYHTLPPKDFHKWAVVCEHVIRHYTEGWANGYHYDMPYWEIWNEPELDTDESTNKRCWGGTTAEFFDFYEIVAKHLKACFPHLKIGGPAIAHGMEWADAFLGEMRKRKVEIDFFSWHIYRPTTTQMLNRADTVRSLLDKHGYTETESILNEWNYVRGWVEDFVYSIECIISEKGAAFTAACMAAAQPSSIDMLMYYDARPCIFNGLFDYYTYRPLKGYYPFYWYGHFYDCEKEIPAENALPDIYPLCGADVNGKVTAMIAYYTEQDDVAKDKTFTLNFGRDGDFEVWLVDKDHTAEKIAPTLTLTLKPNSVVFLKEK